MVAEMSHANGWRRRSRRPAGRWHQREHRYAPTWYPGWFPAGGKAVGGARNKGKEGIVMRVKYRRRGKGRSVPGKRCTLARSLALDIWVSFFVKPYFGRERSRMGVREGRAPHNAAVWGKEGVEFVNVRYQRTLPTKRRKSLRTTSRRRWRRRRSWRRTFSSASRRLVEWRGKMAHSPMSAIVQR